MDPEKQARLEAAGFHVTNDPRDLMEPLEVIEELRARVNYLEGILRLIADNERFNNGATASSIAREALDPNDCDF